MRKPNVSVLTDPMPWGSEFFIESARRFLRFCRDLLIRRRAHYKHSEYRGHPAVTRSLVQGLDAIGAHYNYNPKYPWNLSDTIIVLAGVRTLRQAIELKKKGRIKKLLAGPNIVEFSSDENSILASDAIDLVITPSQFVSELYIEDNMKLRDKIFTWPAGVDTSFWCPGPTKNYNSNQILIFDKRLTSDNPDRIRPYVDYLIKSGWSVNIIVRCGDRGYTHIEYRELLRNASLMIGFTIGSESQGIAWSEAWAMDVPTLIFRNTTNILRGRKYNCSTAPYLNNDNGLFFDNFADFKSKFEYWISRRDEFNPRAWLVNNLSDEVCASKLYSRALEC
jgi:hypothetical protein